MRILFPGGSGKAGRHVIPYLMDQGHQVLNVDQQPLDHPGVDNRIADITDAGEMHDVMHSLMNLGELDEGTGVQGFDAVVHFAAVPRLLMTSDNECYRINTNGTDTKFTRHQSRISLFTSNHKKDSVRSSSGYRLLAKNAELPRCQQPP